MAVIQITLFFNDELGLKSARFEYNDTGLPDDSTTLRRLALTMLKAVAINEDDLKIQDLLNELDIERPKSNHGENNTSGSEEHGHH